VPSVGFTANFIPVKVSYNLSDGGLSVEMGSQLSTPIGVFSVTAAIAPRTHESRRLIILAGERKFVYALEKGHAYTINFPNDQNGRSEVRYSGTDEDITISIPNPVNPAAGPIAGQSRTGVSPGNEIAPSYSGPSLETLTGLLGRRADYADIELGDHDNPNVESVAYFSPISLSWKKYGIYIHYDPMANPADPSETVMLATCIIFDNHGDRLYRGRLPHGLAFTDTKKDVLRKLGDPDVIDSHNLTFSSKRITILIQDNHMDVVTYSWK
jgi:hypothetical protein